MKRPDSMLYLFGAGSPLLPELEESLHRSGREITALVANRACPTFGSNHHDIITPADICSGTVPKFFLTPLFTPANRRVAVAEAIALGLQPAAALLDPTAIVSRSISLAEGSYVNAGVILGAQVSLDRFALVNRGANLGHHVQLGAFTSVGPGAILAGGVVVGEGALIGAGAVVGPGVRIGAEAKLAPGAIVTKDVPAGVLVIPHTYGRIVKS
jgi:hypothetical protein